MKTLKLTLKKQWFDMILSGQKKEEYREVKHYWVNRLCVKYPKNVIVVGAKLMHKHSGQQFDLHKFDLVEFTNGYSHKSPRVTLECKRIEIGIGNPQWGAIANETYFIIKLGSEISRQNIKNNN